METDLKSRFLRLFVVLVQTTRNEVNLISTLTQILTHLMNADREVENVIIFQDINFLINILQN